RAKVRTAVDDKQIEEAIIVVIRPGGSNRRTAIVDDPASRNSGKRPVTGVSIERVVLAIPTDKQVDLPIVVVVRPGGIRPISGFADSGIICDAAEGAIAV